MALLKLRDAGVISYRLLSPENLTVSPFLIINSIGYLFNDYLPFAEKLSRFAPVILADPRGLGESRYSPSSIYNQPTLVDLASDLFDLLLHLNHKRIHIIGHGFGGAVAQQLALLLRGRDDFHLEGLILVSSFAEPPRSPLRRIFPNPGEFDSKKEKEIVAELMKVTFSERLGREVLERFGKEYMNVRRNWDVFGQHNLTLNEIDLIEQLPLIADIPFLIIHGSEDRAINPLMGQSIFDVVTSSKNYQNRTKFQMIEGGEHFLMFSGDETDMKLQLPNEWGNATVKSIISFVEEQSTKARL